MNGLRLMHTEAIPGLFAVCTNLDRVRLRIPTDIPERIACSVEAHLQTARDSLMAAYDDLLNAQLQAAIELRRAQSALKQEAADAR